MPAAKPGTHQFAKGTNIVVVFLKPFPIILIVKGQLTASVTRVEKP